MNIKTVLGLPLAALLATAAIAPVSAATLTRPDGIYVRCDQCGVVQSIEHNVVAGREHGTAGAVIGAIAGGVLGNQVGKGKGRTLATVGGAVGGGFAGNAIGKGGGSESYTLRLKMGTGGYTNVQVKDASAIRQGDIVVVDDQGNVQRVQ
ncbi:Glycine zipper 2TM domain-containing protein [Luteibacter sp. UNCMF331Sha3.1]|uniref:glycine zipper 2TM domain-containing protein n=1 Tax=Luteibacter sp. UNCMF331Sha3.1 TaxID=1502760 RepID=UPI0008CFA8D2|nr:glycine zipper 2TM domain-containing protein [Luteibacter sp. UNCMF331Sha3.1]SEN08375.1 Glycine zipper 2TM domain-containing protein [Luteibacter sp. UNCMF331Sha3.1]